MTYWDKQTRIDVLGAALITVILWTLPLAGAPTVFAIQSVPEIAKAWLGPVLTFLGITGATTSFLFTAIDRPEFSSLRGKPAEGQLWRVFAQNLAWLAVAVFYCTLVVAAKADYITYILPVGTFLIVILSICLVKFVWVLRQILFVRIEQSVKDEA